MPRVRPRNLGAGRIETLMPSMNRDGLGISNAPEGARIAAIAGISLVSAKFLHYVIHLNEIFAADVAVLLRHSSN